jgi:putative ABC transport system permease protein
MSIIKRLSRTWRNLARRPRLEADLDAELRAYVDLAAGQKMKSGMSSVEARRAALIESGGVEQVKERVRDVRAGNLLETVIRDFRFGARLLAKNPGFTAAAVIMLALGIGANTAVFSVVNAVLVRGLPYSEPDRIVALYEKRPRETDERRMSVSAPDFLDWREQNTSFESMAAVVHDGVTWQSDAGAEQMLAGLVSPEFFDVLGVRPALGSGFRKEKEIQGGYYAVILTYGFWQRRFGADPAVLGRAITINGTPREVVAILPANFEYPVHDVELFVPLQWQSRENLNRSSHGLIVAGRLKPGISMRTAQAEMDTIASRLEQQYPVNKGHGVNLVSMREVLLGPVELPLLALQAAVVFVLLIACGNLANLLLARTLARQGELWVRLAIGAGRGRLMRQLLCESTLLAIIGGSAGVGVAYLAVPLLRSLVPDDIAATGIRSAQVDGSVLGACLLLSILCGLIFGLVPAWRGAGVGIAAGLKEGAGGGPRGERLRKALIAAQIALSVVLLTGAGMFLRSFAALRRVDPGFRAPGVLTMQVGIPGSRYREPEKVVRFTSEWMDDIGRLPGVEAVGLVSHLPVSGMDSRTGLAIEGVDPPPPDQPRRAHIRTVSPGYFKAMGLRIVQGRPFLETDRAGSQPVMIVNEAAARKYFPQGKAVGHRGHRGGVTGPWSEVVGVVADVRHWGLDVEAKPEQYYCHLQQPTWMANLAIRASGDPRLLTPAVREQLRRLDPMIPLARVQTMEEVVNRSIASERSILILLGLFAGIALLLTAAGIWGTMAYLLSQRRREIGVRLALGATDGVLVRDAVLRAMKPVTAGLVAGVALSLAATSLTSKTLFGVSPTDPLTYAVVAGLLAAVAWMANYYPARRITRSAPYAVLRQE